MRAVITKLYKSLHFKKCQTIQNLSISLKQNKSPIQPWLLGGRAMVCHQTSICAMDRIPLGEVYMVKIGLAIMDPLWMSMDLNRCHRYRGQALWEWGNTIDKAPKTNPDTRPRSEPTLELHSRAASSVGITSPFQRYLTHEEIPEEGR